MDQPIDLAGARKRRRKSAPAWLFLILAAIASALLAYGWTLLPPPDVFFVLLHIGGPAWAAPYVLVEGLLIGLVAWVAVYFGLFREQASVKSGLIMLAATVLPGLAVSDIARFHYLDVLRWQEAARQAAQRYQLERYHLTNALNADMDQLALFDISYRAWTVHPADFPRFEANLVKARTVLAAYRAQEEEIRREFQGDIHQLPMPEGERARLAAAAARDVGGPDREAFWALQNQELDETGALLKVMERANGGKMDEAEFGKHQAALWADIKGSNERYRRMNAAEEARGQALAAAVR